MVVLRWLAALNNSATDRKNARPGKGEDMAAALKHEGFFGFFRSERRRVTDGGSEMTGVVVLDADEFAEFEECAKNPQQPSDSVKRGMEILRRTSTKGR